MGIVDAAVSGAARTVGRAADMTTAAAGAVGGAAINGVIGGVKGATAGIQRGISTGSHSTPAAAMTLGALGAAGLVEWPVLLVVGGTALVLRQLQHSTDGVAASTNATPKKAAESPNQGQSAKVRSVTAQRARSGKSRSAQ